MYLCAVACNLQHKVRGINYVGPLLSHCSGKRARCGGALWHSGKRTTHFGGNENTLIQLHNMTRRAMLVVPLSQRDCRQQFAT